VHLAIVIVVPGLHEAKVNEAHAILLGVVEDVFWLDVMVRDVRQVAVVDGAKQLQKDVHRIHLDQAHPLGLLINIVIQGGRIDKLLNQVADTILAVLMVAEQEHDVLVWLHASKGFNLEVERGAILLEINDFDGHVRARVLVDSQDNAAKNKPIITHTSRKSEFAKLRSNVASSRRQAGTAQKP